MPILFKSALSKEVFGSKIIESIKKLGTRLRKVDLESPVFLAFRARDGKRTVGGPCQFRCQNQFRARVSTHF